MDVMGEPGEQPPDFAAVTFTLGVTEDDLMAALGPSGEAPPEE